jgi:hypothetical protein
MNATQFKDYLVAVIGRLYFLSYKDIVRLFPVCIKTLYNDRSKGLLQPLNPSGRKPLFHWSHVEAWARATGRLN